MRLSKFYVGALVGVCLLLASCNSKFGAGPVNAGSGSSSPAGPVIVEAQLQGTLPTSPANTALVGAGITVSSVTLNGSSSFCGSAQTGPSSNVALVTAATTVQLQTAITQPVVLAAGAIPTGCYSGVTIALQNPTETLVNNSGIALAVNGTPATCGTGTPAVGTVCSITPALDIATVTFNFPGGPIGILPAGPMTIDLTLNLAAAINGGATISVQGFDWNPTNAGAASVLFPGQTSTIVTTNNVIGQVTSVNAAAGTFTITQIDDGAPLTVAFTMPVGTNGCVKTTTGFSSATQTCPALFSNFNAGVNATTVPVSAGCATANTSACLIAGQIVDVNYTFPVANPGQATAFNASTTATTPALSGVALLDQAGIGTTDINNAVQGTIITSGNATTFTMIVTGFALSPSVTFTKTPSTATPSIGEKLVVTPGLLFAALPTGLANSCPAGGTANFGAIANTLAGQSVIIDITALNTTAGTATADVVELVPSGISGNLTSVGGVTTSGTSSTNPTLIFNAIPSFTGVGTLTWNATTNTTVTANPLTTFQGNPVLLTGTNAGKLTVINTSTVTPGDIAVSAVGPPVVNNMVRVGGELFGGTGSCTTPTIQALQVGQP